MKKLSYLLFIFTAAASFLFFTIQLTSSKIITPVFGGIAWVWILTMLFYQAVLLLGYFVAGRLKEIKTRYILAGLGIIMITSSFVIKEPAAWSEGIEVYGMIQVIRILLFSVGLPGLTLSASTIILQKAAHSAEIKPWQLYFYSNIGSLSAIFLYPFVIDNVFSASKFIFVWKIALIILGAAIFSVSLITEKKYVYSPDITAKNKKIKKPQKEQKVLWLLFSALPSAYLAVVAAFLTEDISAMPLLWALPLGMFMLAFALPFAPSPVLATKNILNYILCTIFLVAQIYFYIVNIKPVASVIIISLISVFYVTWIYVSGLVNNKPEPEYLENFYVSLAVGGFLGNFSVSVISPSVFNSYIERWIITIGIMILPALLILFRNEKLLLFRKSRTLILSAVTAALMSAAVSYTVSSGENSSTILSEKIASERSMYGVLRVIDRIPAVSPNERLRTLRNGNIMHGFQGIKDGEFLFSVIPEYYGQNTPIPYIFQMLRNISTAEGVQDVAIIGLGAGVQNIFNKDGTRITFFEIDRNVEEFAEKYFSYLSIDNTDYSVEIGDGRLLIGQKPDEKYSFLIVDAFTGDTIPRHLVTKEAIKLYSQKIKENGIIALHTSNRYLDVEKIVNLSIHENGLYCYISRHEYSTWVIASKKPLDGMAEVFPGYMEYKKINELEDKAWKDDYTPLIPFLKKVY